MRVRGTLAGVLVLAGFAVPAAVATAPVADAHPATQTYTCTGTDWAGNPLRPVTFQAAVDPDDAAHRARTEWRGAAKYSSIVCRPG